MTREINTHFSDVNKIVSGLEELYNLLGVDLKLGIKTLLDQWKAYQEKFKKILIKDLEG